MSDARIADLRRQLATAEASKNLAVAAAEEAARESAARSVETWVAAGGEKDDLRGIAQCLRQKGLHDGQLARHTDLAVAEARLATANKIASMLIPRSDAWMMIKGFIDNELQAAVDAAKAALEARHGS